MSAFCNRFELHRLPTILIALLLWILLHFLLILRLNNLAWADSLPPQFTAFIVSVIAVCCAGDAALLLFLTGLAKGLFSQLQGKRTAFALAVLLMLPVYFYFLLMAVSWALFLLGISFLDVDIVRAFLVDTAAIWKHFSQYELLIAAVTLLGPLVPTTLFFLLSPARSNLTEIRSSLFALAVIGGAGFLLLHVVPQQFGMAEQRAFRISARQGLLPNISLFWSRLLPTVAEPEVADFSYELTPRYSLVQYAAELVPTGPRPNIIFIMIEALRSDMVDEMRAGTYVMPTLHRMSHEGLLVQNILSQSTESAYSTTSIVTGLYPMKFGIRDTFVNRGYPHTRVYDVLAAGGYRAGFFSSANENWQNMARLTNSAELDTFFHSESDLATSATLGSGDDAFAGALEGGFLKTGKLDDAVTMHKLIGWLKKSFAERPAQPVFATVSLQASHFPYAQGAAIPEVFAPSTLTEQEQREISFLNYPQALSEKMKNRYRNSLHYIDGLIQQLMAALHDTGHLKNTIFVVTGDHGELFHEHGLVTHGSSLFNTALSVPLVVYQTGKRFEAQPRQHKLLDVAPTLVDLAGLPPFANFQGQSMFSVSSEAPVFSSLEGFAMQDAVVFRGMKLVFDRRKEEYSLYDVASDWAEQTKLVVDDSSKVRCLKKLLSDFRARQLKYFSSFELYSKYFPPRHDSWPAECE